MFTFHPLPSDIRLALESNSKLFEVFFSFSKTIQGLLSILKFSASMRTLMEAIRICAKHVAWLWMQVKARTCGLGLRRK